MRALVTGAAFLLLSGVANADSLHGNCFQEKGAPCTPNRKITTDAGTGKARIDPRHGNYELDLGDMEDRIVTVFCDGRMVGSLRVQGRTLFVVRCDPHR